MPYKDRDKQKEAVKKAVDKHRGITKGITSEGITPMGITDYYPPVVYALLDPVKRKKLEYICQALRDEDKPEVRYGVEGPTFDTITELLSIKLT